MAAPKKDGTFVPTTMIRTNQEFLQLIKQLPDMQMLTVPPGKQLFKQDERAHHVYFISRGIAKCYITEDNGKDYILEFFGEGEIIGELELLRDAPILSNVDALTELTLYKADKYTFWQLIDTNKDFNRVMLKELATRVSQLAIRVSYQQLYPVEYSVLKLLSLFSHEELPLSKQDLADYMAITVRSLNRSLKQLKERQFTPPEELELSISSQEIEKLLRRFEEA